MSVYGRAMYCVHFPPYETASCYCDGTNYTPEDNLEYLEWCLNNKNETQLES